MFEKEHPVWRNGAWEAWKCLGNPEDPRRYGTGLFVIAVCDSSSLFFPVRTGVVVLFQWFFCCSVSSSSPFLFSGMFASAFSVLSERRQNSYTTIPRSQARPTWLSGQVILGLVWRGMDVDQKLSKHLKSMNQVLKA